jgi:transposase-like protein
MIDCPITDLLDDAANPQWLEQHLHPNGLHCPHYDSADRRFFRQQESFAAYWCRDCDGYYIILTGTVFAKTQQSPATLVLLLRGCASGEPTARLAWELGLSRQTVHTLRQRVQNNMNEATPCKPLDGTAFEADELYQNAGKKSDRHPDPADPPRRRANKRRGHGTFATDRPPIFSVVSRDTGEIRYVVCDQATKETCRAIVSTYVPPDGTIFYTDEWSGYHDIHPVHSTVCHSDREWAYDDDGDRRREVHYNTCKGWGAALHTFLRVFRGVPKAYLACYVAMFEALANAKRITPALVRRMCYGKGICT